MRGSRVREEKGFSKCPEVGMSKESKEDHSSYFSAHTGRFWGDMVGRISTGQQVGVLNA